MATLLPAAPPEAGEAEVSKAADALSLAPSADSERTLGLRRGEASDRATVSSAASRDDTLGGGGEEAEGGGGGGPARLRHRRRRHDGQSQLFARISSFLNPLLRRIQRTELRPDARVDLRGEWRADSAARDRAAGGGTAAQVRASIDELAHSGKDTRVLENIVGAAEAAALLAGPRPRASSPGHPSDTVRRGTAEEVQLRDLGTSAAQAPAIVVSPAADEGEVSPVPVRPGKSARAAELLAGLAPIDTGRLPPAAAPEDAYFIPLNDTAPSSGSLASKDASPPPAEEATGESAAPDPATADSPAPPAAWDRRSVASSNAAIFQPSLLSTSSAVPNLGFGTPAALPPFPFPLPPDTPAPIDPDPSPPASAAPQADHARAPLPLRMYPYEEDLAVARMVSESEDEAEPPAQCSPEEPPPSADEPPEEVQSISEIVYPAHFFRRAGPRSGDLASLRSSGRSSRFRTHRSASFDSGSERSSVLSRDDSELPDAASFLADARALLLSAVLRCEEGPGVAPSEANVLNRRRLAIQSSPAYLARSAPAPRERDGTLTSRLRRLGASRRVSERDRDRDRASRGGRREADPPYVPHHFDEKPVGQLYRYRGGVLEGCWLLRRTLENATLCAAETSVRALSEFADYSAYLSLYSQALRREKESEGRCVRWRGRRGGSPAWQR
ncbi:hypothetical protein DFJ74DRAFT_143518 [Hyaloraphidium curvatum]|nr:hypothetical protein DFJ74DRAFT_143518 [Hyaloraphidium curvatum]